MTDPNSTRNYRAVIDELTATHSKLTALALPDVMQKPMSDVLFAILAARGQANSIVALRERARYPDRKGHVL